MFLGDFFLSGPMDGSKTTVLHKAIYDAPEDTDAQDTEAQDTRLCYLCPNVGDQPEQVRNGKSGAGRICVSTFCVICI